LFELIMATKVLLKC